MRAVNLIPVDERRGGGASHSGIRVWLVLAGLTAAVVGVTAFVLAGNTVSKRRAELSRINAQTTQVQNQLGAAQKITTVAALRQARVTTVGSLAASRFNWERTMRQMTRVLPRNVWLTSFLGTVSPQVQVDGAASGSDTASIRSQNPVPAVELAGCTTSQSEVARVMARLRLIQGVNHVTLAASEKNDAGQAGSSGGSSGGGSGSGGGSNSADCRNGSARYPRFQMVIFFAPQSVPGAAGAAPGTAGATPGAAPGQPAGGTAAPPAQSTGSTTPAPAPSTAPVAASGSGP